MMIICCRGLSLVFIFLFKALEPAFSLIIYSLRRLENMLWDKIDKERREGRILGPFHALLPFLHCMCPPLGVVPKKAPGKYCLIQHLSYPSGGSINDSILDSLCSVSYTYFDHTISTVRQCGPVAELAKYDIKSAFYLLLVNPKILTSLVFYLKSNSVLTGLFSWLALFPE